MARYFFHIESEPASNDAEGRDCADLEDARLFAASYAGAILKDVNGHELPHGTLLLLRVVDEAGETVFLLEMRERLQ